MFTIAGLAEATPVPVNITASTVPGESIFASANHPAFGGGDITKAVKLSPENYPVWAATFDLPPGLVLDVTFVKRQDGPADLGNPANGSVVGNSHIVVPPAEAALPPSRHLVFAADGASTPTVQLTVGGATSPLIAAGSAAASGGRWVEFIVDGPSTTTGGTIRIFVGGTSITGTTPIAIHARTVWWRNGQGFAYMPTEAAPSAPRVVTYTFVPGNTTFKGRTVRVLLPRGYDENPGRRYPMLFAEDGQNVFSPGGPFGSWDLDLTIKSMTGRAEIPEIILVGFDNTSDRIAEYIPEYTSVSGTTGRGDAYLRMIRDELLPDLRARYRIDPAPASTAHIGSSLGGITGFEAANEFSATFGSAVIMSPSFWIGMDAFLVRAARPPAQHSRMWIDSGNSGDSNDDYVNNITIRDALLASGHVLGPDFAHSVGLGQQHNEAAWRTRSPDALRWLYAPMLAGGAGSDGWVIAGSGTGD